jgi:hypothetical protein
MPIYFLIVCLITAQIGAMQPDEARKTTNDDGLGECSPDIALGYMLERKTAAYLTCRPFLTAEASLAGR